MGDVIDINKTIALHMWGIKSLVYCVLLDEEGSAVSNMVKKRWSDLYYLAQQNRNLVTLFFFERPEEWPQDFIALWRERLENNEEELNYLLEQWSKPPDRGIVYKYTDEFGLATSDLPLLVLCTSPEVKERVVLRIPDLNEDDLFRFFKSVVDTSYHCIDKQQLEDYKGRLECLKQSLAPLYLFDERYVEGTSESPRKPNPILIKQTEIAEKVSSGILVME